MTPSSSPSPVRLSLWLTLAAVVIVLDQLSKLWIVDRYVLGDSTTLTSYFNLVRAHNTGAAFSFLAGAGGWQRWFFVTLGAAASAFIVWMLRRHPAEKLMCFALTMILGGAIGNVIDRLVYGYVVDFLQFHWDFLSGLFPGGYFPAFNLADSAITLGAICLIVDEIRRARQPEHPA